MWFLPKMHVLCGHVPANKNLKIVNRNEDHKETQFLDGHSVDETNGDAEPAGKQIDSTNISPTNDSNVNEEEEDSDETALAALANEKKTKAIEDLAEIIFRKSIGIGHWKKRVLEKNQQGNRRSFYPKAHECTCRNGEEQNSEKIWYFSTKKEMRKQVRKSNHQKKKEKDRVEEQESKKEKLVHSQTGRR